MEKKLQKNSYRLLKDKASLNYNSQILYEQEARSPLLSKFSSKTIGFPPILNLTFCGKVKCFVSSAFAMAINGHILTIIKRLVTSWRKLVGIEPSIKALVGILFVSVQPFTFDLSILSSSKN